MTEKLYYEDSYTRVWDTSIKAKYIEDEKCYVILDETAFYPHGGGQPCDHGLIDGIPVMDVTSVGPDIVHQVERLPEQEEVHCILDWERRFDHMQQHSGQHLLSAVCLNLFGAETDGFHLGEEIVTIDVNTADFGEEQMRQLEKAVNMRIYDNRLIRSYFVAEEDLHSLQLVKKPKVTEEIRIVEIEGIEYNPCGGTHVNRTGEIGIIKLLKAERQKSFTRLSFKCGARALADYREAMNVLSVIAMKFNTGRTDILNRFGKWEQEQRSMKQQIVHLQAELEKLEVTQLLGAETDGIIAANYENRSLKELQRLAASLVKETDAVIMLASRSEQKLVCVHNGNRPEDIGKIFKGKLPRFHGRGGGKANSAQAGFAERHDLEEYFTCLKNQLKG
ncbi:MAG: alanyl-tRNA editing protein [Bacillus sp. (in: firmicutes)]